MTSPARDCDWSSLTPHSHAEAAEDLTLSDASTDAPSPAGGVLLSVCRAARTLFVDHDYLMMAVTDIVEVEASPDLSDADDNMTPDSLEMGQAGAVPGYLGLDVDEEGAWRWSGGGDEQHDENVHVQMESGGDEQHDEDVHVRKGSGGDEQHDEDVHVQMGPGGDKQHDEDVHVQMESGGDEQHDEDVHVQKGSGGDEQHDEDVHVQMGLGGDEQHDEDAHLQKGSGGDEQQDEDVHVEMKPGGDEHDEDVQVRMGSDGVGDFGMGYHLDVDGALTQGTLELDQPTHLINAIKSLSFEDPLPTSSGGDGQELLRSEEPICVADNLEDLSDGTLRSVSEPPSPAKTQMWGAGVVDLSPASSPSYLDHHDEECVDDCHKDAGNEEKEINRVVTPSKMVPNVLSCVVPIGGLSGIQQYNILEETSDANPEDGLALSQKTTMNNWIVDIEADALDRFTYYNKNTEGELPDIFLQDDELHEPLKPSPAEDAEELQRQTSDVSTSSSSPNRDLDALYLTQCAPLKRKAAFKKQKQLPIKKTRRSWEQWYDQFKSVVNTGKQKFLSRSTVMSSDNKENLVPLRCDSQSPKLPCSQQDLIIPGSRNKQTTEHYRSCIPENIGCLKQSKGNLEAFGTSWEHDESHTGRPDKQKGPEKVKPQQSGCSSNKSACRQLFKWLAVEPSLKGNDQNAAAVTDEPECNSVPGNSSSASRTRSVVRVGLSKRARPRPLHQQKCK
ncbi:hypothetical protein ONE63_005231 [Megalurothrips usitatus]|uniref:Uncharacterized protein n=1 Tax=Megalurothrips usitatus TaxID=439358 RepID=A0AAV7XYV4_9NEOP|nr:hypothetical protein ONE63_005231 [Megalurothrips usitatus]